MNIWVNGREREIEEGLSLAGLLRLLKLEPPGVIVEHNESIVPPAQLDQRCLRAGDKVEIVHPVGGGSV